MRGKRILVIVAALLLSFSAACAEEAAQPAEAAEPPADLFDLLDYGGESAAWAGSAIPISEDILLAPVSVLEIPADQLAVSDGACQWEAAAVLPADGGRFAAVFYNPGETAAQYGSWPLLPLGDSVAASACTVRFGDSLGSRINRGVLSAEEISWQGERCYLLSLTDTAPAGSPVLTEGNELAGIVIAQWADGVNTVLALPAEGIARGVSGVLSLLAGLPEWADAPEGLEVTVRQNAVTIDWSEMSLPETKEGERVWMVLYDTGNSFLTSWPADGEDRKLTQLITPGRFYIAGPVVSSEHPGDLPAQYISFCVPEAESLTDYHFKPVQTAIAELPADGQKEGGAPVPVTEVTEELLRSNRAFFYSHSTYQVVTVFSDRPMLITLTDPDGNNYRYESSWMYSPDLMKEDIWYLLLKDTGLTELLDVNGYPPGLYRMAFYVDGKLADSFTFELAE